MNPLARHNHTWSDLIVQFAQEAGVPDYRSGPLTLSIAQDSPTIVVEVMDDRQALGLAVDLTHAPDPERFEAFLAANRLDKAQDVGVYAFHEANGSLLFCRRLEHAEGYAYDDLVQSLQAFAHTAQLAVDALPGVWEGVAPEPGDDHSASHADTFRHLWADLSLAQGFGQEQPEPMEDGSLVLLLEGHRYVLVRPDFARGCVVLTTMLALLPLFGDEPPVWRSLLQTHTLGQGTGGAVFAIDADAQELIAWRSLPLEGLDAYGLNDAIDSLAEVARFYVEKLALDPFAGQRGLLATAR